MSEPTELHRRFLEVWPEYERMIASSETLLAEGKGDPQACSRTLITMYRWLGGMSLALGKPDDVARDYFRRAATSAVRMMGLPGSTVGPRVVDVELSVSANGKVHVDSERSRPAQVLSGKPSLIAYLDAMTFVVAFGSADDIATMARYGPDDYHTEGLVVGRDVHRSAAGLRAWLRGQDDEARRELRSALRGKPTPGDAALLAVAEGDAARFARHLAARLDAHRHRYRDEPLDPDGLVCVDALGLCRLAAAVGIPSAEAPFIPIHLTDPLPHRDVVPPPPSLWSRIAKIFGGE
jgi:hypothetical protein